MTPYPARDAWALPALHCTGAIMHLLGGGVGGTGGGSNMPQYEAGNRYPIAASDVKAVTRILGMGAMIVLTTGVDLTRGRRYVGNNSWEFWRNDGHKVRFGIASDGGVISCASNEPDDMLPEPLGMGEQETRL